MDSLECVLVGGCPKTHAIKDLRVVQIRRLQSSSNIFSSSGISRAPQAALLSVMPSQLYLVEYTNQGAGRPRIGEGRRLRGRIEKR